MSVLLSMATKGLVAEPASAWDEAVRLEATAADLLPLLQRDKRPAAAWSER